MNRPILLLFATITVFALFGSVYANDYFTLAWDSTTGRGPTGQLAVFNGPIVNNTDEELRIVWTKEDHLPNENWTVEFCQGQLLCWPYFVYSDTLDLPPHAQDTLEVKFTAGTADQGSSNFTFDVVGAPVQEQVNITFTSYTEDVSSPADQSDPTSGWFRDSGFAFRLPVGMYAGAYLYDLNGRRIARLWSGFGTGKDQLLTGSFNHAAGVYFIRIEAPGRAAFSRKITIVR